MGMIGGSGLTNCIGGSSNEFPAGSGCGYGSLSPWIAGIKSGSNMLVSTGGPWDNHYENRHELFPSNAPWDSLYIVQKGDTVDIPFYKNNYTAKSNEDIIGHYNDYSITSVPNHVPMGIDIIQRTYTWTGFEFIVHRISVVFKNNISDVWLGMFGNMAIGCAGGPGNTEFGWFDEERKLAIYESNDPSAVGPTMIWLIPESGNESTKYTWLDGAGPYSVDSPPDNDADRYLFMSAGNIFHDEIQSTGYGHYLYSVGPFQAQAGDTLHYTISQIYGVHMTGVEKNYQALKKIVEQNYRTPSPPPRPPLKVSVSSHQVNLNWEIGVDDRNPETYTDSYRMDNEPTPFAGYRVYKSSSGLAGPWTLLAEYDRTDDQWDNNFGLSYSYSDKGLLNNFNYYYTVTSFSKPDTIMNLDSQESSLAANAVIAVPGTAAPKKVGQVIVVPNPYLGDQKYYNLSPPWEGKSIIGDWTEEYRRIQFVNLPNPSTIKIYTLNGKYVSTIEHSIKMINDQSNYGGTSDWNLTSYTGQAVSSGIYLFTVEDNSGSIQKGKFVIIK
jgi:hypothetical protein